MLFPGGSSDDDALLRICCGVAMGVDVDSDAVRARRLAALIHVNRISDQSPQLEKVNLTWRKDVECRVGKTRPELGS